MPQASILPFHPSHIGLAHNLIPLIDEHRINFPPVSDIEETVPALDDEPQDLEGLGTAITNDPCQNSGLLVINGCPYPHLVAPFAHKSLQFIQVADFWDFFRFGGIWKLMSRFSNPMHNSGVMNLGDSFDATQSHAIEIHFDTQLLDIIRVSPRTVGFEELPTAMLALVALSASSMSVFSGLSRVTLRTFHIPIMPNLPLLFQQRRLIYWKRPLNL